MTEIEPYITKPKNEEQLLLSDPPRISSEGFKKDLTFEMTGRVLIIGSQRRGHRQEVECTKVTKCIRGQRNKEIKKSKISKTALDKISMVLTCKLSNWVFSNLLQSYQIISD